MLQGKEEERLEIVKRHQDRKGKPEMVLTTLPTNKFFNFSHELNFSYFLFRALYSIVFVDRCLAQAAWMTRDVRRCTRLSEFEKTFVDKLKTRNED